MDRFNFIFAYFFENSSKDLNKASIFPSLEFNIEENSSFWVRAKLRPSIIKSLIKGFSGFLVYILQSIFTSGLSDVPINILLTIV